MFFHLTPLGPNILLASGIKLRLISDTCDTYRALGKKFVVSRFYYKISRARYLMLSWIARHIDQADRTELWLPADEYPETWLADIQVTFDSVFRAAMSRVLDVEKNGDMNVDEGNFSARIIDPLCPWNEGMWRFESSEGRL
jgi:hypothetical protein